MLEVCRDHIIRCVPTCFHVKVKTHLGQQVRLSANAQQGSVADFIARDVCCDAC